MGGSPLYNMLLRPYLFRHRDPEESHEEMKRFLSSSFPSDIYSKSSDIYKEALSVDIAGKVLLDGPIGLAAGFDKNAEMLPGLANIFDYVTVGTMLPYKWDGNPKSGAPGTRRIVRLDSKRSMLNCLGFPFNGIDGAVERLGKYNGKTPVSVSIAVRPPAEGQSIDQVYEQFKDMLHSLASQASKISMIEANFASPNTKGLATFFEEGILEHLLSMIRSEIGIRQKPLFLKMPPHTDDQGRERNLAIAQRWLDANGNGITVINTLRMTDNRLSMGYGGLSGAELYPVMLKNLKDYRAKLGREPIINAVGGVFPENIAEVMIDGQADTVQVLTPFIFYGPTYVHDSKVMLVNELKKRGFASLAQLSEKQMH